MKKNLLLLFLMFLIFGCKKDENESNVLENSNKKSYINNLIPVDTLNPYTGDYYIHVSFRDQGNSEIREITYFKANQSYATSSSQSPDNTMLGQGVNLKDTVSGEELEVHFYFYPKTDTSFNIIYANYRFADPWRNISGANILYFKPVESQPHSYYLYLGINSTNTFFKIDYIDTDRINGSFQTIWKECCGGKSVFNVSGDFSIPIINSFIYNF